MLFISTMYPGMQHKVQAGKSCPHLNDWGLRWQWSNLAVKQFIIISGLTYRERKPRYSLEPDMQYIGLWSLAICLVLFWMCSRYHKNKNCLPSGFSFPGDVGLMSGRGAMSSYVNRMQQRTYSTEVLPSATQKVSAVNRSPMIPTLFAIFNINMFY